MNGGDAAQLSVLILQQLPQYAHCLVSTMKASDLYHCFQRDIGIGLASTFFRASYRGYVSYTDMDDTKHSFWVVSPSHVYTMDGVALPPTAYASLALPQGSYWGVAKPCGVDESRQILGDLLSQLCNTFASNPIATLMVIAIPMAAMLIPRLNPADNPIYIVWGPPSTGKTTVVNFMLQMLGESGGLISGGEILQNHSITVVYRCLSIAHLLQLPHTTITTICIHLSYLSMHAVTSEAALRNKIFPFVNHTVVGLDDCEALFQTSAIRDFLIAVYSVGQWSAKCNTVDAHMHPVLVCTSNSPVVQMKQQPNDALASRFLRIPFGAAHMDGPSLDAVKAIMATNGASCIGALLNLAATVTNDDVRSWEAAIQTVSEHAYTPCHTNSMHHVYSMHLHRAMHIPPMHTYTYFKPP